MEPLHADEVPPLLFCVVMLFVAFFVGGLVCLAGAVAVGVTVWRHGLAVGCAVAFPLAWVLTR